MVKKVSVTHKNEMADNYRLGPGFILWSIKPHSTYIDALDSILQIDWYWYWKAYDHNITIRINSYKNDPILITGLFAMW